MQLQQAIDDDGRKRIDEAVVAAEQRTAAEIVPLLTDASGRYDRAEDTFGLLLAMAAVAALWVGLQGVDPDAAWATASQPAIRYDLRHVLLTIAVASAIGAAIASRVWWIRHLLTPRGELQRCVEDGAMRAFALRGLGRTTGATGVLIYVSLFERMIHVHCDEAAAAHLNASDVEQIRDAALEHLRRGDLAEGFCSAIALVGDKLAGPLPAAADDVDEMPNQLVVMPQGF